MSRKNSFKRQHSKRQTSKDNLTCQSNLNRTRFLNVSVHRSILSSNTTKTIIKSQQKNIHNEEQQQSSSVCTNDEKNSIDCFDKSNTYLSLHRTHRITPGNSHELFNNDFKIDCDRRHQNKNKKRIISRKFLCKLGLCILLSILIISGIIGIILYATNQKQNSTNSSNIIIYFVLNLTLTNTTSACTFGAMMCTTPILSWNKTGICTPSAPSYRYLSCCYRAISSQLTIEFQLIEEVGQWHIDDISMTQGNAELVINGGFESNFTGWTVISSGNLSITPLAYSFPGGAHSGSAYLYSIAASTSDYIKQTVNVIQNQDVNVSFWWYDEGGVAAPTEKCEGYVILTP
ncbi:hypothetical protein I4U23_010108 [Adineta vaga]|nr:hypothetical protein I4U23_010108 [Adineta vaga]